MNSSDIRRFLYESSDDNSDSERSNLFPRDSDFVSSGSLGIGLSQVASGEVVPIPDSDNDDPDDPPCLMCILPNPSPQHHLAPQKLGLCGEKKYTGGGHRLR